MDTQHALTKTDARATLFIVSQSGLASAPFRVRLMILLAALLPHLLAPALAQTPGADEAAEAPQRGPKAKGKARRQPLESAFMDVPAARLAGGYYTDPAQKYRIKIPALIMPGARIKEKRIEGGYRAQFTDDMGTVYSIQRVASRQPGLTLEQIMKRIKVDDPQTTARLVIGKHGKEIRDGGIERGASPLAHSVFKDGRMVEMGRKDLVVGTSMFLWDGYFYNIIAGSTPLFEVESESAALENAEEKLELFLRDLSLQGLKVIQKDRKPR